MSIEKTRGNDIFHLTEAIFRPARASQCRIMAAVMSSSQCRLESVSQALLHFRRRQGPNEQDLGNHLKKDSSYPEMRK